MANYGMYSGKGDNLVHQVVKKVLRMRIDSTNKDIYDTLTYEFDKLEAEGYGEVWDTDVRERVISTIEKKTNRELTIYF